MLRHSPSLVNVPPCPAIPHHLQSNVPSFTVNILSFTAFIVNSMSFTVNVPSFTVTYRQYPVIYRHVPHLPSFMVIFCIIYSLCPIIDPRIVLLTDISSSFRVVNEGQGSFAMGFQQIVIRFLGFVPAPVMFGALIDKSCELWQTDSCTDETASCLEYNNQYFR